MNLSKAFSSLLFFLSSIALPYTTAQAAFCNDEMLGGGGDDIFFEHCAESLSNGPFYFKIYIHVITDDEGNVAQSESVIYEAVDRLREDFAVHNIHFVWDCQINYVESPGLWVNLIGPSAAYIQAADNEDGIDIIINRDNLPGEEPSGGGS
ncbi:MAG: hypothetical protein AAGJ82_13250, partial [Bacteroidota bacterium]